MIAAERIPSGSVVSRVSSPQQRVTLAKGLYMRIESSGAPETTNQIGSDESIFLVSAKRITPVQPDCVLVWHVDLDDLVAFAASSAEKSSWEK